MPLLRKTYETSAESRVQVECRLNSDSTASTVIIRQKTIPSKQSPHQRLTGSKVLSALAQVWLAANEPEAAIICAKAGVEELGDDYASPFIEDDTDLKLILAEERIEDGYPSSGAEMMLRVLENRILLYSDFHQGQAE